MYFSVQKDNRFYVAVKRNTCRRWAKPTLLLSRKRAQVNAVRGSQSARARAWMDDITHTEHGAHGETHNNGQNNKHKKNI